MGSTIALTDGAGALTTQYAYDPFGRTTTTGLPSGNPFQFTGREHEGITGFYYYRARYYHPGVQRFISEDPLGFEGGETNIYAYVRNHPTLLTDPFGLWCPECHQRQTLDVADACGFSPEDAAMLVNGNLEMDRSVSTLMPESPKHAMPGSRWREYVGKQLVEAIRLDRAGNRPAAMRALGRGLHAVQDAWAHDLRHPQGTMTVHIRRCSGNPDDPSTNPFWWNLSRQSSAEYMKDFMKGRGIKPTCD